MKRFHQVWLFWTAGMAALMVFSACKQPLVDARGDAASYAAPPDAAVSSPTPVSDASSAWVAPLPARAIAPTRQRVKPASSGVPHWLADNPNRSWCLGTAGAEIFASTIRTGFDLFERAGRPDENAVLSPAGALFALALPSDQYTDALRAQLAATLGLNASRGAKGFMLCVRSTLYAKVGSRVVLDHALRFWHERGVPFHGFYGWGGGTREIDLGEADFRAGAEAGRRDINEWVADQTHGAVTQMVRAGELDDSTRLVLTSAVHLPPALPQPFARIADGHFATSRGRVKISRLWSISVYGYAEIGDVRVVDLPLQGGLSMAIVLPKGADSLSSAEQALVHSYEDWMDALRPQLVEVVLPRLRIASEWVLDASLRAIGLDRLFKKEPWGAPGTRTIDGMPIETAYVDRVIHAASLDMDIGPVMGEQPKMDGRVDRETTPIRLYGDRPFLFVVRHEESGIVLFVGRVVDPARTDQLADGGGSNLRPTDNATTRE